MVGCALRAHVQGRNRGVGIGIREQGCRDRVDRGVGIGFIGV